MTADSLIVITSTQLKQTNLIFVEHQCQKEELLWYDEQLTNYQNLSANLKQSLLNSSKIINNYKVLDSSNRAEISALEYTIEEDSKKIRYRNYGIIGLTILTIIGFIL